MAEIARNSVLQSSFDPCVKAYWIGESYRERGVAGNDITRTNLPNMRCLYRHSTLNAELTLVGTCAAMAASLPSPAISKVEPTV